VAFGSSLDAKEQVRQAIDIVDLVGSYLQLRREGRGYKATCPWHDDSRPSLQVNPERQSFRCWVCDIGGDVFTFMMKYESVSFPEALAMLADRAGITLASTPGQKLSPAATDEKRTLFQAMAWAEQQYEQCLLSPEGEAARAYLKQRGVQDESLAKFHLGFAPDRWDWLLERARGTRYSPKILETVGLVGERRSGNGYYDRFKGRVLFSIRDVQGRPVGLGGRILPGSTDENAAKYVNSPETPLFSKSNLLYGLDFAKEAMTKSRTALVMEGYTDSLIAQQCGIGNAIAVLGTALGERHIRLLRRFVDSIVLVLDGDEAGRRRTDQILELFVAEQMDLRILTLPDSLDPCDFLLSRGADAFRTLLAGAVDALDHKFQTVTGSLGAESDTHAANKAVEEILATLAKAPRLKSATTSAVRLKEDQILHRLARKFGLGEDRLRERLSELRRPKRSTGDAPVPAPALGTESGKLALAQHWLLEILIQRPELLAEVRDCVRQDQFRDPRKARIYATFCSLAEAGLEVSFDKLMLETNEPEVQSLLVELDDQQRAKNRTDPAKELRDLLRVFREDQVEREGQTRTVEPAQRWRNEEDELDALRHLVKREQNRQGISGSTDG
jgi:DNA primase